MSVRTDKPWTFWRRYSYTLITLGLFVAALAGHWVLSWFAFANEHPSPQFSAYLVEVGRDTFENWQSEFLQLVWQVAGLAFLFHVGSSQSEESDERQEEKIDAILRKLSPHDAEAIIQDLD